MIRKRKIDFSEKILILSPFNLYSLNLTYQNFQVSFKKK